MSYPIHDGSASRLYMRIHRPLKNVQGMAIHGDEAFVLFDTGVCAAYDLVTRNPNPKTVFPLGCYNSGKPSRDYLNHANQCMFGTIHLGDNPLPLLYVTAGAGIGADEDGYYYRLCVENLTRLEDGFINAETVQTITYQPSDMEGSPYVQPGWGCPAFFVDTEDKALYIFSARYRTKRGCTPEGKHNAFIITKFPLPALDAGPMVRLTAGDIVDQFVVESDTPFTQGGQLTGGILHYTFGCPKIDYPSHVMAFDVKAKKCLYQVDNLTDALNREELECCDWYKGQLLLNTNDGGFYILATEEGDVHLD